MFANACKKRNSSLWMIQKISMKIQTKKNMANNCKVSNCSIQQQTNNNNNRGIDTELYDRLNDELDVGLDVGLDVNMHCTQVPSIIFCFGCALILQFNTQYMI